VFGNFEKRLPIRERGYYNEFTVKTPASSIAARGASSPEKAAKILQRRSLQNLQADSAMSAKQP
jgi:hypothetical protein